MHRTSYNVGIGDPNVPGRTLAVNPDGSVNIVGALTANLAGFAPNGAKATANATNVSSSTALPVGTSVSLKNLGTKTAFFNLSVGAGVATASDQPIAAGETVGLAPGVNDTLNVICDGTDTTTLALSGGTGLVTGYGGASGAGSLVTVVGDAASGAAVAGNPLLEGGRAATTNPGAVADGQAVAAMLDVLGKAISVLNAPRALKGAAALTITADTGSHTLIAAGSAGTFNDIESIIASNTSATATRLDISDGTVTYPLYLPAGDTRGLSVATVLPETSSATAWTAQLSVSVTDVRIAVTFAKRTG